MRGMIVKLYPNRVQLQKIQHNVDSARFVYNHILGIRKEAYMANKKVPSWPQLSAYLTCLKTTEGYEWLQDAYSQSLQMSLRNLKTSYTNFFRNVKHGRIKPGFPSFKSRKIAKNSYQYPQSVVVNPAHSKIRLPGVGWVKMRGFRDEFSEAAIKTVTITIHKDGRVTASLLMDYTPILPQCTDASYVGIDVGIRKFATDSNNTQHEPLDLSSTIASIKKLQRSIDRQTQAAMTAQEVTSYKHIAPSNNMVRTRTAIAKLYQKLINKRDNYIHHVANTYLGYRIVYVEDLQITDLLASFIGTIDSPNLMSRRDKRLHNLIASQSWGKFYSILEYKLAARGSKLVKVPPAYTSQMCSSCGTIDKKSRDGESYHCRHCGYTADADHNAAMNIAHIGRTTVFRLDEAA